MATTIQDIRDCVKHLIDLSYETGYLSAQMTANPPAHDAPERDAQRKLVETRTRVKIQLFALIDTLVGQAKRG